MAFALSELAVVEIIEQYNCCSTYSPTGDLVGNLTASRKVHPMDVELMAAIGTLLSRNKNW